MAVNISGFELLVIQGDLITADLIIWRKYRCRTYGIVEAFLDLNPHLAHVHRTSPFIPVGTQVRIPIDYEQMKMKPSPIYRQIPLWAEKGGYRL